jgi:hypothetical protein
MGRKTIKSLRSNQQSVNLNYPVICAFCNSKYHLNNHAHVHTKKHAASREIFLRDNPEFKESVYQFKLSNLKKLLYQINFQNNDITQFISKILTTDPSTYDIDDVIAEASASRHHQPSR